MPSKPKAGFALPVEATPGLRPAPTLPANLLLMRAGTGFVAIDGEDVSGIDNLGIGDVAVVFADAHSMLAAVTAWAYRDARPATAEPTGWPLPGQRATPAAGG